MATKSIIDKYTSEGSAFLEGKGPFVDKAPDNHPSSDITSTLHINSLSVSELDLDGKQPAKYEDRADLR